MQIYFQVEYIILTEDAFPCSKVQLKKEKVNSEHQRSSSCCKWLSKIYGRFFITKKYDHNDGIEKEDILLLEDKVKEELQDLKKEMEKRNTDIEKQNEYIEKRNKDIENRHASMQEELTKMLCILETIQQKVLP